MLNDLIFDHRLLIPKNILYTAVNRYHQAILEKFKSKRELDIFKIITNSKPNVYQDYSLLFVEYIDHLNIIVIFFDVLDCAYPFSGIEFLFQRKEEILFYFI